MVFLMLHADSSCSSSVSHSKALHTVSVPSIQFQGAVASVVEQMRQIRGARGPTFGPPANLLDLDMGT